MQDSRYKKFKIRNPQSPISNSPSPIPLPQGEGARGRAGFTLLEILIALTLLGITLVVILQLFSANMKGIAASDDYVNGVIKAESIMREILDDDELTEGSWSETTEDGYAIDAVVTSTADDRTENLPLRLLEINLSLHWTEGKKEKTLAIKTMKAVTK